MSFEYVFDADNPHSIVVSGNALDAATLLRACTLRTEYRQAHGNSALPEDDQILHGVSGSAPFEIEFPPGAVASLKILGDGLEALASDGEYDPYAAISGISSVAFQAPGGVLAAELAGELDGIHQLYGKNFDTDISRLFDS